MGNIRSKVLSRSVNSQSRAYRTQQSVRFLIVDLASGVLFRAVYSLSWHGVPQTGYGSRFRSVLARHGN